MPELPEVETVRKELEPILVGKTLDTPIVYFTKMIKSDYQEYVSSLKGKSVTSVSRRGKYLLIHLDDNHRLLFHLRMEGKLYVVDKERHPLSHLSMFIPFLNSTKGLAFYDTRKFGVSQYLKEDEEGLLKGLGPEPFEIKDSTYLYRHYHRSSKMIKELLLDQSIMSGLGNIYANEVLFACQLSPFLVGKKITRKDCESILQESIRILDKAIELNGSTIRTYHAREGMSGEFQNFLKVYGRQGKECPVCHHIIEKRFVSGRGTEYCPYCQHTGISLGITGKIASGKSLATHYFSLEGFVTFSADEEVHKLYQDETFLKELRKKFPMIFTPTLDKGMITRLLQTDANFKRRYLTLINSKVKERVNDFIIHNNAKDKALEIPLLFDAHMQKMFTYLVGVETTKQKVHLRERGEDIKRADFNKLNSYDRHRYELDYILHTDSTKRELRRQVRELSAKLKAEKKKSPAPETEKNPKTA